jgi:peptide/nickel transport system substrate-binding protein
LTVPPGFNLYGVTTYTAVWPVAPCMNQLVQFNPATEGLAPSDIIPDLAERWEQPDPTTIVFNLRKGVSFHDGSPFSGEDVRASLDWIKRPPQGKTSPRAGLQATLDTVEVVDPSTVRLKLTRPTASYLLNLASNFFGIGSARDIEANAGLGDKVIGTGPFKFKTYQRGSFVELEKNPTYHVAGRPYLDGLKFYILPDYTTALANYLGGQYQVFIDPGSRKSDADRIRQEMRDRANVQSIPFPGRDIIFTNARRKPFDDVRVRQAISLALDRDAAINIVREGDALRGGYMAPKGSWAISERDLRGFDGYDKPNLDKAKQLLTAAGVTTPVEWTAVARTDNKDNAELVKDQLAKLGITVKLNLSDLASAQPLLQRGDFDLGPWSIGINIDDPDAAFSEIATTRATRNWSAVLDPRIDELFERQSQELNFEERKKKVQELEKYALSQYHFSVLYFANWQFSSLNTVRGLAYQPSIYTNQRFESVWLRG